MVGEDLNPGRHPAQEVYRRFLDYVLARLVLARNERDHANAYTNATEFRDDLNLARQSLSENGGERVARFLFDPLLRQVDTFGFHLHTLDVREHANVHKRVLLEVGGVVAANEAALPPAPSPETVKLLDSLKIVSELKRDYPSESIRSYVISGTQLASDVAALVSLAELSGVQQRLKRTISRSWSEIFYASLKLSDTDRDTLMRLSAFEHVRRLSEIRDYLTANDLYRN